MRKPDFFIVGAPKSGTTAMADYLGQHPDIFMPEYKDSNTFGSDLLFEHNVNHPPDKFRVDYDTFLSWYKAATTEARLGEASVLYLVSKRAAEEIKAFNPSAQIIAMLRNPVDMLYAVHGHFLLDLNEDIDDFSEALDAEADRRNGKRIPATCYTPSGLFYSDLAAYSEHLSRYFRAFGRENIHVIIFDDMKGDTSSAYRDTLEFLGVDPNFEAELGIRNAARRLRSRALQQWIVNPPWPLRTIALRLSRVVSLRNLVNEALVRLNTVTQPREPMSFQLRRHLQDKLRPEVERLSELLGRDLTHWTQVNGNRLSESVILP